MQISAKRVSSTSVTKILSGWQYHYVFLSGSGSETMIHKYLIVVFCI